MINSKKKGFTIVELVIVIAVVAILAAVLIPTFSNLVKKANVSADTQAVRQMNTALAIYEAENGKPTNVTEAKKALDSQLINVEGGLVPVSKGYAFYWDSQENEVVLVKYGETIKASWEILTANAFGKLVNASSKEELINALNTTGEPVSITLTNDVTYDGVGETVTCRPDKQWKTMNEVTENEIIEIDLNGKTLNLNSTIFSAFYVHGGNLTIKNGKLVSEGVTQLMVVNPGIVTLKDVKIEHNSGQTAIAVGGISDVSIVGCTITTTAWYGITSNSNTNSTDGVRISVVNTKVNALHTGILLNVVSDITIDGCEVAASSQGLFLRGNNALIKNSKFTCEDDPNDLTFDYYDKFEDGNKGPIAAVTLHAGGEKYGGDATFNYVFENVTADTIVAGTTENGKIIVSGVNLTRPPVTGSNVTVK